MPVKTNMIVQLVAAVVLVVCVVASAGLSTAISAEAGRAQLVYTDVAEEGDPPEIALGVAMGAFRGLFVNYLWIRANQLKEEGKFYEAIELSKAITRLQPRFPRVWSFHAWNMAYNISVATNTASERWMWVKAGIDLLRNQAIPRNPNDTLLHKELAWIFIHKIQGWSDDANHYYKKQVAREWTILLGRPPDRQNAESREDAVRQHIEWLESIAQAPRTLDAVIEEELEDRREAGETNPSSLVRELVNRIQGEVGIGLDFNLLTLYTYHRAMERAWYVQELGYEPDAAVRSDKIDALLEDERYADAWERLIPFVRRRILTEDYHMELGRMIRYTREIGPLDWRHPATHALYWSKRGVEEGLERQTNTRFNLLNTDRVTLHAVQELFRFGDIHYDILSDEYFTLPNLDYTDTYGAVLDGLRERDTTTSGYNLYSAGYENFLRDVIRTYYNRGNYAAAEHYHTILRTADWRNENDPFVDEELTLPLKDFVEKQLDEDRVSIPQVALSEIDAALTQAFLEGLLGGRKRVFAAQMTYAKRVWDKFRETQNVRTLADPEAQRMGEYVGESFTEIVIRKLVDLLAGGRVGYASQVSEEGFAIGGGAGSVGRFQSSRMYRLLPLELQQAVYDRLKSALTQRHGVSPAVLEEYWPEPPGMEEFRERREQQYMQSDEWLRKQVEFLKQ